MKFGLITRSKSGWCSTQLQKAMMKREITPLCFGISHLVARVGYKPEASVDGVDILQDLDALITRPIGRGSLEEIIFRMDLLHQLESSGMPIINPPTSIERSVDKYYTLSLLENHGVPVPRTAVTESDDEALESFHELGEDVVVKPLFGSRGVGTTRISDPDVAARVFRTIAFHHGVLYLQEFLPHGFSDLRAFVIGDRVIASMRRRATTWKTNVSQGAKPVSIELDEELKELAVKAAHVIGCKVAGVDILESPTGPVILELNSQPGWRGLQSVTTTDIAGEIIEYTLSEIKA